MERKEFTVHDRLGPLTLTGVLLSDQRFGSDRKPRWTDMALYEVVETEREQWLTARCTGCTPKRVLLANTETVNGAPVICGQCDQPFIPERTQNERPFRYALEIIARSWVYHRMGSSCVKPKHKISKVAEIWKSEGRWRNLMPCERCKPSDLKEMRDEERIAEERSDTHVYLCSDARSVVRRLYRHSGEISLLAARLLRDAAHQNADIASAIKGPRRI